MKLLIYKEQAQNNGLGKVDETPSYGNPADNPYPVDPYPRDYTPTNTGGTSSTTDETIYTGYKPPVTTTTVSTPVVKTPTYTPKESVTTTTVLTPVVKTPTYTPKESVNTPVVQQQSNEAATPQKQWIKGFTNFQTGLLGLGLLAGTATVIIVVATPKKKGKK